VTREPRCSRPGCGAFATYAHARDGLVLALCDHHRDQLLADAEPDRLDPLGERLALEGVRR
jgi:hypothetical protein